MARIACLGWGSLTWEAKGFAVRGGWSEDGPAIPVEFARQSSDGRMTLVLVSNAKPVKSLWAVMQSDDLASAVDALRDREGIPKKNVDKHVCRWSNGQPAPSLIPGLPDWALSRDIEHVVWTGLPPKFDDGGTVPTAEQVVEYLGRLTGEQRARAEQYVRLAPRQINTEYRRCIESALDWRTLSDIQKT